MATPQKPPPAPARQSFTAMVCAHHDKQHENLQATLSGDTLPHPELAAEQRSFPAEIRQSHNKQVQQYGRLIR